VYVDLSAAVAGGAAAAAAARERSLDACGDDWLEDACEHAGRAQRAEVLDGADHLIVADGQDRI